MEVEFSSVFKKEIGIDRMTIALEKSITVEELVSYIAKRYEGFKRYTLMKGSYSLGAHLNFVREGHILLSSDLVDDQDHLKVFLPVTGG
jgi:hypothetical protein